MCDPESKEAVCWCAQGEMYAAFTDIGLRLPVFPIQHELQWLVDARQRVMERAKATLQEVADIPEDAGIPVAGERTEEVSFIETTTWGKLATVCAEYLTKGRGVRVVGRIKHERWEDPDGNSRAKVVIVAEHVEVSARAAPVPRNRRGPHLRHGTGNRFQLTRMGERRATNLHRSPVNPAAQASQALPRVGGTVMQNHRGSQRRRQERRENKRVERELLTDTGALRSARERAMVALRGADAAVGRAAAGLRKAMRDDAGAGKDPSQRPLSRRELDVLARLERYPDKGDRVGPEPVLRRGALPRAQHLRQAGCAREARRGASRAGTGHPAARRGTPRRRLRSP